MLKATIIAFKILFITNINSSQYFYQLDNTMQESIFVENILKYDQDGFDQHGFDIDGYGKEVCMYDGQHKVNELPDNNTTKFYWSGVSMPTITLVDKYIYQNYIYNKQIPARAGNGSAQQIYPICRREIKN